jgi:hypothetical protein
VGFERALNDAALDTFAASMDQPHLAKARGSRGVEILLHDRRDVTWREGVEIDLALDRDAMHGSGYGFE